jgi:hypothetical protein
MFVRPRRSAPFLRVACVGTLLVAQGCVFIFRQADVAPVDPEAPPTTVRSPVKAHLADGSTVLFPDGATFAGGTVSGRFSGSSDGVGTRYTVDARPSGPVRSVPLDSVVAMETFPTRVRATESVLVSAVATPLALLGVAALSVAIFGSCPTVYADSAGALALEAESFSNSIAPLLEVRDVDRLAAQPGADGALRLEVRNEALETHYLNHLELVEAAHRPDETAVPAPLGGAYALSAAAAPTRATDRAGADVAAALAARDAAVYRTADPVLAAVTEGDPADWIELTFPAPAADTAAVALRLRNSLFSTVYFYDYMLAQQGAASLDWIHSGLANVSAAIEMGDFYTRRMGLRVQVWDGAAWAEVGRVIEPGPIAWSDAAVVFPTPPGPTVRVRLHFVADAWRIDRVALAAARTVPTRPVPLAGVEGVDGAADDAVRARLGGADEDYHVTQPGDRLTAVFEPGPPGGAGDGARTYFLAAQGYYIEWVRGEWLRARVAGEPFRADDATLVAALHRWRAVQGDYEARFDATRIPVR